MKYYTQSCGNTFNCVVKAIETTTGKIAKKSGKGFRLPCTGHNGKNYNLYIADGTDRLILHCHSRGCDPKNIIEAAGLTLKDIFYEQLSPEKRIYQKCIVNDRKLKSDLETELLILLFWLSDFYKQVFPVNKIADRDRVILALKRVQKVAEHYLKVGV